MHLGAKHVRQAEFVKDRSELLHSTLAGLRHQQVGFERLVRAENLRYGFRRCPRTDLDRLRERRTGNVGERVSAERDPEVDGPGHNRVGVRFGVEVEGTCQRPTLRPRTRGVHLVDLFGGDVCALPVHLRCTQFEVFANLLLVVPRVDVVDGSGVFLFAKHAVLVVRLTAEPGGLCESSGLEVAVDVDRVPDATIGLHVGAVVGELLPCLFDAACADRDRFVFHPGQQHVVAQFAQTWDCSQRVHLVEDTFAVVGEVGEHLFQVVNVVDLDAVASGHLVGLRVLTGVLTALRVVHVDAGHHQVHDVAEEHPWGGLHEIPRVRVGVLFGGGAEQFGEFVRQIRVCAEQVRQPVVGLLRVFLRVGYLCCGRGGGGEGVGGLRQRVRRGGAQLRLCRKRCGVHISGVRPVDTLVQFLVAVGEDVVKVLKGFERVRQRRDDTGGHGGVLFRCPENVLLHLVGHADGLHLDVVAAHLLLGRVRRPLVHIVLLPISGGDGVVSHCPSCSCRRRSAANPDCPGCGAARRGSGCSTGRLGRPTRSPAPARTAALR